jgi:hypothetical protein
MPAVHLGPCGRPGADQSGPVRPVLLLGVELQPKLQNSAVPATSVVARGVARKLVLGQVTNYCLWTKRRLMSQEAFRLRC